MPIAERQTRVYRLAATMVKVNSLRPLFSGLQLNKFPNKGSSLCGVLPFNSKGFFSSELVHAFLTVHIKFVNIWFPCCYVVMFYFFPSSKKRESLVVRKQFYQYL